MVLIRPSQDAALLARLHREGCEKAWLEADFESLLAHSNCFALVAFEKEAACGFIFCSQVESEAEILTLVISPDYRRRGIAFQLVQKIRECIEKRGGGQLFLEVAADNVVAQQLYGKAGFGLMGRRKDYYDTPQGAVDAVTMVCEIPAKNP